MERIIEIRNFILNQVAVRSVLVNYPDELNMNKRKGLPANPFSTINQPDFKK